MARSSRSRLQLTEEQKKERRREQKKMSMRRARAKMDEAALEERRRKDREAYSKKKERGLVKSIKDLSAREQRQIRKIWREKSKLRREKFKLQKQTQQILQDNTPPSTPRSSFSRVSSGRAVSARNRRQLKAKNVFLSNKLEILEKKLAMYRMKISRLKAKVNTNFVENKRSKHQLAIQAIHEFLLDDENSRLTAGKKETITRRKVKKQIRLLNDSLFNLHKVFLIKTKLNISYTTFRRCRPFWVLFPKAASRNTCLCSLHSNTDYIVQALHQAKVITFSTATAVAKFLCCNGVLNVHCLEKKCAECRTKTLAYNNENDQDTLVYQRWVTKSVTETIKGKERQCKKTIKETVKTTKLALRNLFEECFPKFRQHLANIHNQCRAIRFIKQNLSPSEGLLHIDFSENYECKYNSEVQSAHFGGSKGQLSLHTCVYCSSEADYPNNLIKTTSFCTVSENTRHDPVLICAHLKPVLQRINGISPHLKELHILSDGPTTQYRNKTMFNMIINFISKLCNTEIIVWHFGEAGHGKGAPDGVGGCVKRTCDKAVAYGKDITDASSFLDCMKDSCKGIELISLTEDDIPKIQEVADASKVCPFKGTFQIHQLSWSCLYPKILQVRRLSCITCAAHTECPHFGIGKIVVEPYVVSEAVSPPPILPSTPSSTSSTSMTNRGSSPGTSIASTVTGPRTPLSPINITPSPDALSNVTPHQRPVKKFPVKKIPFFFQDSSDEENMS